MISIGRIPPSWNLLILTACTAVAMSGRATAQTASKTAESPQLMALVVSPAAEPVPALKYRLVPSSADLNPGDAAPIYLRIGLGMQEELKPLDEKTWAWLELPFKDFPSAEARKVVDNYGIQLRLEQIEFGTRRKTCDWNYTVPEQRLKVVMILLPDAQSMRIWSRLLAVKARVEIAERRYDDAIRTIETGIAFGRHVGDGPFLINGVIGGAIVIQMLDRCEELVTQPDAPNLYWALTALPRPLVDHREQLECEAKLFENLIPELGATEMERPRTPAEWASFLARLHEGLVKWIRVIIQQGETFSRFQKLTAEGFAGFKSKALPAAKGHLKATRKLSDEQFVAMSEDQIVATYIADELIPALSEAQLDRPRTPAEWGVLLARLYEGITRWNPNSVPPREDLPGFRELAEGGLARFKARMLPAAKGHLKVIRKLTDEQLGTMSEDQIVADYIAVRYRELWDDHFKESYLPAGTAISRYAAAEPRRIATKQDPFRLFVQYSPALQPVAATQLRADRHVAALRVIEAIRLHSAAHDGALPASLERITEVPVPDDPATGKPFEYHLDGNSAILSGPLAGMPPPGRPSYRITIRR